LKDTIFNFHFVIYLFNGISEYKIITLEEEEEFFLLNEEKRVRVFKRGD
jgi:hypothetical protein